MRAWERVQNARDVQRPTSAYYVDKIFDGFIELKGDRGYADDQSVIGGIAWLGNIAVTVIAQEKGRDIPDKVKRNFGCPHPEGYRKSLRLMKQAEKFHRPIITIVDTQGAYCGIGAEERGQGQAIANNLYEMANIKVPIICVFIGEGGSGGALALAVADRVAMLDNSLYSILSPEGFASILWKDGSRAEEAAEVMKITAEDLFKLEVIDEIIEEPVGGAQNMPEETARRIKQYLNKEIALLSQKSQQDLVESRYQRFRKL